MNFKRNEGFLKVFFLKFGDFDKSIFSKSQKKGGPAKFQSNQVRMACHSHFTRG